MHGTRGAAQNWEDGNREAMESLAFRSGKASTCVFSHAHRDTRVVVHGDDFTALGSGENLKWLTEELKNVFELKSKGIIGPGPDDQKQMRVLTRVITWDDRGITYGADQRHAEIVVKSWGRQGSKQVVSLGERDDGYKEGGDQSLSLEQATKYRGIVARGNYLGQDRPDMQFAVEELSRRMASPTGVDERK